jgi:acetamidase/formamidase
MTPLSTLLSLTNHQSVATLPMTTSPLASVFFQLLLFVNPPGVLKLTLHKADSLPLELQDLDHPLIEQPSHYVVQGYTYKDYLTELAPDPSTIYGESSIDKAMTVAYNNTRDWVMRVANLTEDQAITAITVAVDFGVTQVS